MLNGMHLESTPDFSLFYKGHGYHTRRTRVSEGSQIELVVTSIDGNHDNIYIAALFHYIRESTFTYMFYTEENTAWLLTNYPELRYKKVIELGAGNGKLASLLEKEGVDIEATDIKQPLIEHQFHNLKILSAQKVFRRYSAPKEDIVFLIATPGGSKDILMESLLLKAENNDKYTFIILNDNSHPNINVFQNHYSNLEFSFEDLPSSFNAVYDVSISKPAIYRFTLKKITLDKAPHQEL